MRFEEIKEFDIEELSLDEGNYRFQKAKNQEECVKKIYNANNSYFRGLMKSIAEDDLGEPILVYQKGKDNIVSDGNRRISALKVLHSDSSAPNDSIKQYATELRKSHTINFSSIQAQVSNDKKLVSRTVYERHSSGKNGTSRIPWNAYAAARFGFDTKIGDDKEWYIMALLSEAESKYPSITSFIDSSNFSYEVFRRLARAALKKGVISENIFSERGERIKKTARKDLVKDAATKAKSFLNSMSKKELTLSRKGEGYADQETVEKYLKKYNLSPDNQELEDVKNESYVDSGNNNELTNDIDNGNDNSVVTNTNENLDEHSQNTGKRSAGNGINKSDIIVSKLETLKSQKLINLYYSLCTISLNAHPALMYVGAWSFLEVLSNLLDKPNNDSFPSFLRNKMKSLGFSEKNENKDFGLS